MTEMEPVKARRDASGSYLRQVRMHQSSMLCDHENELRSKADWKKAFCDAKQCDLTIW